jgi:hypothetical protein
MDKSGSLDAVASRLDCGRDYLADLIRTSYLSPRTIDVIPTGASDQRTKTSMLLGLTSPVQSPNEFPQMRAYGHSSQTATERRKVVVCGPSALHVAVGATAS